MAEWGAIVTVTRRPPGGRLPWRVLDVAMEALADHAGITGSTDESLSVRLFLTAPDRTSAAEQAKGLVLAALRTAEIAHDPGSATVLTVDPMAEFESGLSGAGVGVHARLHPLAASAP
jgi:hypothetical protein